MPSNYLLHPSRRLKWPLGPRVATQDIWLHGRMFIRAAPRGPWRGWGGRLNNFLGAWAVQRGGEELVHASSCRPVTSGWSRATLGPAGTRSRQARQPLWHGRGWGGNGGPPPARCLCLLIIHTRAPRMPCVITSYAWAQPKGSELHLAKERRKRKKEKKKNLFFFFLTKDWLNAASAHALSPQHIIWFGGSRGFVFKGNIDATLKNTDFYVNILLENRWEPWEQANHHLGSKEVYIYRRINPHLVLLFPFYRNNLAMYAQMNTRCRVFSTRCDDETLRNEILLQFRQTGNLGSIGAHRTVQKNSPKCLSRDHFLLIAPVKYWASQ